MLEQILMPIMLIGLNLQLFADETYSGDATTSSALSAEMKTYYEMRLLDSAEPKLVHDQFGEAYPIPKGGGKTIEFRRVLSLPKNLNTLVEGVTPSKKNMEVVAVTAEVDQYGDWIQSSDLLELTTIDPILEHRTRILGSQAGRTLDTITREVINGGTNVIYCDLVSGESVTEINKRSNLVSGCNLSVDSAFMAAAQLSAQDAEQFDDGYVGIIHPYSAYDLMRNKEWIDISKYSNADKLFKGEIGKLGGVRFVEASEAKVFLPNAIVDGVRRMKVHEAANAEATSVKVVGEYTPASEVSIPVYIDGVANTVTAIACTEGNEYSTLTVTALAAAVAAGDTVCGTGAGKNGDAVFSTIVLARGSYGVTELTGGGLQHIVKQLGYGDDPLNQRSSSAWKATKVAKRLNEQYMVRVESVNKYSQKISDN